MTLRYDLINTAIYQAQFANPGNDVNEQYEGMIQHIEANVLLTNQEKEKAKELITDDKDKENLLRLKGPKYKCNKCKKAGFTISFCEHCVRETLRLNFTTWTSGNDVIDNAIRQAQLRYPFPRGIIEWIEYEDLTYIKYFTQGGCSKIFTATWTKGFLESFDNETRTFKRSGSIKYILKQLSNSHNPNEEFLKEVKLIIYFCLDLACL